MSVEQPATTRRASSRAAGLVAAVITALVGALFAWLGIVNGDEGWYGLAAQAVGRGRVPYRDFAFTQGPVYPYLLAPFVRLWPSLTMTRAISVILASVAVGLLVMAAGRLEGRRAGISVGLAFAATIPSLPYWLSITKTYALTFLLLAVIVYLLSAGPSPNRAYPFVAVLAVMLGATRTTGLAIAVPLVAALLIRAPNRRTRVRVVGAVVLAALPIVVLALSEWRRVQWNLYSYHQLSLLPATGPGEYLTRSIAAVRAWPGPVLFAIASLVVTLSDADSRALLRRRLDVVAFAVGIPLFVLMHETTSQFFAEEYLAPIVGIMLFSCCVLLLRIARRRHEMARRRSVLGLRLLIAVGIVTTAVTGGHTDYLGASGWRGSIAGLKPITRCVRQYSRPDDTVFAMYLEEVVLQSQRRSVPGVSLGSFSYQDLSTAQARSFRMLNHDTLIDIFRRTPPKVLVLTVFDFDALSRAGWFSHHHIDRSALNTQFLAYRPVCQTFIVRNIFINIAIKVDVYVRKS